MPRYMVDCWETAIRFRTVEVEADTVGQARLKAELAMDKVDFSGAEWNETESGTEDIWREDDE